MANEAERCEGIKWNTARAVFLGSDWKGRDLGQGLKLASKCNHKEAQWLCSLFPNGVPATMEEMRQVFLSQKKNVNIALYFAAACCCSNSSEHDNFIRQAAIARVSEGEPGYPLAQAWVARNSWTSEEMAFRFAVSSVAPGEPASLCFLGECFLQGIGCNQDSAKGIRLLKEAAELENPLAQFYYGKYGFEENVFSRYHWWRKAFAHNGGSLCASYEPVQYAREVFQSLVEGRVYPEYVYEIGLTFAPYFDAPSATIFDEYCTQEELEHAKTAVALYRLCVEKAREATVCWLLVGKQFVAKDIRVLIGKMIQADKSAWSSVDLLRMAHDTGIPWDSRRNH
jgi:hypothetical protein